MIIRNDLTGQVIGKLTVMGINEERSAKSESNYWDCRCECGKIVTVRTNNLTSWHTTSCGCNRNSECCKAKGNRSYRDLRNQKFSKLTVLEPTEKRDRKSIIWKCKCDCGTECFVSARDLVQGEVASCRHGDCIRIHDFTNKRFGYLTALEPTEKRYMNGAIIWKCKCDCGNIVEVTSINLVQGKVKSCGCKTSEMLSKQTTISNMTRGKTKANTSGCVGVCWNKEHNAWKAQIGYTQDRKKKTKHLGYFKKYEDAVVARKQAESDYFTPVLNKLRDFQED